VLAEHGQQPGERDLGSGQPRDVVDEDDPQRAQRALLKIDTG
jgi:hypothetical protein